MKYDGILDRVAILLLLLHASKLTDVVDQIRQSRQNTQSQLRNYEHRSNVESPVSIRQPNMIFVCYALFEIEI